jgi:outer membrane protein TolC
MFLDQWLTRLRRNRVERRACARRHFAVTAATLTLAAAGCTSADYWRLFNNNKTTGEVALEEPVRVPYAPPVTAVVPDDPTPVLTRAPLTVRNLDQVQYREITLDESVRYALANSKIMRELGTTILRSPEAVETRFLTASQYTDPQFGPEAALAAFDAQFATRAFFENNDRVFNNRFQGGGTFEYQQDLNVYETEISKRAATGTAFALRNTTQYDSNNAPANLFDSAWWNILEGEVRHPLLQGGGLEFNRIAGPDAIPGVYRGVVVARVNNEISQTDFEIGLRDFVSDVSNAYWELYYAYRILDARKKARDEAYEVLQRFEARANEGGVGTDRVALAREQYYRFQREVEEALSGRPLPGTQTDPGGGALRGIGGVLVAERRLRLLMGWPITDECLLRPSTEPIMADVQYDWPSTVSEATMRRTELRRQKLLVKRRELELTAAKNFLSPRLDALAQYRFRGFGDDLTGPGGPRFNNALDTFSSGDFQEWQLGVEFSMPIGFRRGHAAVQNAELLVARERAVLQEQERRVVHDLSNAIAEKDRAYLAAITTLERLKAADTLLRSLQQEEAQGRGGAGEGAVNLDRLLDAQRRVAEAEAEYYLNRTAYEVALKNVAFEKGSLLDYHDVYVTGSDESRTIQASATSVPPGPPAEGIPPTPAPVPDAAPASQPEAPAEQPPA